jgi:hydroxypyruvate isomerase
MPRFAANLSMTFNEVPFLERFAAAARAGFAGVEFLFPYAHEKRQLSDLARAHGLEVVLFNMPPGDWDAGERGIACDPSRVGEFQDGIGKAVEYAAELGCRRIHCMAGLQPRAAPEDRIRETYVANLRLAAAELHKRGMHLLVEAINTRDIPGYYLTTTRQALEVIREVGMPNLLFQFDVYHVQIMEGDLAPKLEQHLRQIGHVQVADTPGRHEPGTGEINYPFLFRHIDRIGYQGWIGCEYRPLATTEAGLEWVRPWLRPGESPPTR